jgi:hypothetical protein
MTAQERLQQYIAASPKNTVAVSQQHENALRQQRGDAHSQNQVRMIDTARRNQQAERDQIIHAEKRRTQHTDRR